MSENWETAVGPQSLCNAIADELSNAPSATFGGKKETVALSVAEQLRFVATVASSRLNYLSQLRSTLIGWGGAKIQLKILCNARSEAFDFLGLSALMLRSNN
jgi:hypothetical protein